MKRLLLVCSLSCTLIGCSLVSSSSSSVISTNSTSSSNTVSSNSTSSVSSSSSSSVSSSNSSLSSSQSSQTSSGGNNMEIQDGYVVYINLDGFGRYYYDEAVKRNKVPTLKSLEKEGVVFKNFRNFSPSITNPVQAMIVSGASSNKTHNVYRYYDEKNNIVVQQARENDADTLYKSAVRNKVPSATIQHFVAESVYSTTNKDKLYIKTPFGEVSNYASRFDQAIKLVKGEQFKSDSTYLTVDEVPRFITIYCDDLDAIGHNESAYDTFKVATSEEERVNNVITRLSEIDAKLNEFMDACKERGIYDKMTFFLTADHGMQGFGAETKLGALTSKYSKTKWPELKEKIESLDSRFKFEYVAQNKSPASTTTVVGVGSGLQMPLTFKGLDLSEIQLQNIKKELKKEYYISEVFTKDELLIDGFWRGANVDLLVIPSERYHFHGRDNQNNTYAVRGQHDTWSYNATYVYGAMWGANVKKVGEITDDYRVTSFGSTMAYVLNIDLLDATAPVLEDYLEK